MSIWSHSEEPQLALSVVPPRPLQRSFGKYQTHTRAGSNSGFTSRNKSRISTGERERERERGGKTEKKKGKEDEEMSGGSGVRGVGKSSVESNIGRSERQR